MSAPCHFKWETAGEMQWELLTSYLELFRLLGYYAALGSLKQTFRDYHTVHHQKSSCPNWIAWTLRHEITQKTEEFSSTAAEAKDLTHLLRRSLKHKFNHPTDWLRSSNVPEFACTSKQQHKTQVRGKDSEITRPGVFFTQKIIWKCSVRSELMFSTSMA